jgi:ABC-type transport system involved in multi-copper enzyme maturation permease subunit
MIQPNYLAHLLRSHRVLLAAAFLLVAAFQVLILTLVRTFDLPALLEGMMRQVPLPMQQVMGEEFLAQFSVSGAVAFGYNHPMVLVTLMLVAILLPARHVAGEIEDGTLELLFSLPVRRLSVAATLWGASGLALLVLVLGCGLGSSVAMLLYPEARVVPAGALLRLGLNLWVLAFAISSLTLLLSAHTREGGKASLRAAGLTLLFYFAALTARLWTAAAFLGPFSPFHYYRPQDIIRATAPWARDVAVLALLALATGTFAVYRITRRDIPG